MQRAIPKMESITRCTEAIFLALTISAAVVSCQKVENNNNSPTSGLTTNFALVNLISNNSQHSGATVDPNLLDGWGITFSPTGNAWISSEGSGVIVIYDVTSNRILSTVSIPSASTATGGQPTGTVFNSSTTGFVLPGGGVSKFIFVGGNGVISGWSSGTTAEKVLDNSPAASYTGVTIANDSSGIFLYAANFKQSRIDVFDSSFHAVTKTFTDPDLPKGYSPFNIQNLGGQLYVAYAKLSNGYDEKGAGLGYVDIFKPDGTFVDRFASRGELNAPWGIAIAPPGFLDGDSSDVILIANFGDGRINAYYSDAKFIGQLSSNGTPITIDGLWGISFAPASVATIPQTRLYFAAGPNDEQDGLFGYIDK